MCGRDRDHGSGSCFCSFPASPHHTLFFVFFCLPSGRIRIELGRWHPKHKPAERNNAQRNLRAGIDRQQARVRRWCQQWPASPSFLSLSRSRPLSSMYGFSGTGLEIRSPPPGRSEVEDRSSRLLTYFYLKTRPSHEL